MQPFERIHKLCPYCGHYPEPALRTGPDQVDGDLLELDEATLMRLRGEIARVDGDAVIPYGAAPIVAGAVRKRHWERREAQGALRNAVAWWAGLQHALGHDDSESYRLFYFKFGTDALSCQTLGAREAGELAERVILELDKHGVQHHD